MSETQNIPDAIRTFVERLVAEKGFSGLEPEVLEQIKKDLEDRVEDRVNAAILNSLPEDKLPEFERLLQEGSDEEIQQFCVAQVPDLESVIATTLISFRSTYLGI
jgi:hypothetical protein